MALCIACSSEIHEQEDCPYRDPVREMRRAGIDVTTSDLRKIDDAARLTDPTPEENR